MPMVRRTEVPAPGIRSPIRRFRTGHSPFDQFGPQDVEQSFHPELIVGREADLGLGPVELDGAVAAFEVVPLARPLSAA